VMKGGFFMITTPKADLLQDTTVRIVDTARRTANNDKGEGNYNPSGIVLLLLCRLDAQRGRTGWKWGHEHLKTIESSKTNIINASMGHFGSEGRYFSYGNKGNFGMVDGSSVGQYVNRKFNTESSSNKSAFNSMMIEEMVAKEIGIGIDGLCKLTQHIKSLIAPIITTGFNLQQPKGAVNLKEIPASSSGLWQTSISVNAQTKVLHTENDATYTVINVPDQQDNVKKNKARQYTFLFKLCNKKNICFKLRSGVTFVYSGKLLTHHQTCNLPCSPTEDMFFNFGSYGTERLYRHIRTSFDRKKN